MLKILFSNPEKAHPCTEPRRLPSYARKSVQASRLWSVGRTQKRNWVNILMHNFAHTRKGNPLRNTWLNFACG